MNSEGRADATRVADEINEAKLETAAERKVTSDQRTAYEKMTQKRDDQYQHQEMGLAKWEQEATTENDMCKMAEAKIERMSGNAITMEADYDKILEKRLNDQKKN